MIPVDRNVKNHLEPVFQKFLPVLQIRDHRVRHHRESRQRVPILLPLPTASFWRRFWSRRRIWSLFLQNSRLNCLLHMDFLLLRFFSVSRQFHRSQRSRSGGRRGDSVRFVFQDFQLEKKNFRKCYSLRLSVGSQLLVILCTLCTSMQSKYLLAIHGRPYFAAKKGQII